MRNFLPPTELFREKKIEIFFDENQKRIIEDIKSFPQKLINEIDFEEEAENILKRSSFNVPKLMKEKTTTGISTLFLSSNQLPPGTLFQYGKKYEVEVAEYTVPFVGNSIFFKLYPNKYHSKSLAAVLSNDNLVFKLTNHGLITGNEPGIELLKQEFLSNIEATEKTLLQIEEELSVYLPKLKVLIIEGLKSKKQHLDIKRDSTNKLNPFKI